MDNPRSNDSDESSYDESLNDEENEQRTYTAFEVVRHPLAISCEWVKITSQPRFGEYLMEVRSRSTLMDIINQIKPAMQDDLAIYASEMSKSLALLRDMRDKHSALLREVLRASCQSSLPFEIRRLLRSMIGEGIESVGSRINVILHQLEEDHSQHTTLLKFATDAIRRALKSLYQIAKFGTPSEQTQRLAIGWRGPTDRCLKGYRRPIINYLNHSKDFLKRLKTNHNKLADYVTTYVNKIDIAREKLQEQVFTRLCRYQRPQVMSYIRQARDLAASEDLFKPEEYVVKALVRLFHLCRTFNDY